MHAGIRSGARTSYSDLSRAAAQETGTDPASRRAPRRRGAGDRPQCDRIPGIELSGCARLNHLDRCWIGLHHATRPAYAAPRPARPESVEPNLGSPTRSSFAPRPLRASSSRDDLHHAEEGRFCAGISFRPSVGRPIVVEESVLELVERGLSDTRRSAARSEPAPSLRSGRGAGAGPSPRTDEPCALPGDDVVDNASNSCPELLASVRMHDKRFIVTLRLLWMKAARCVAVRQGKNADSTDCRAPPGPAFVLRLAPCLETGRFGGHRYVQAFD